jgi:antitoxin HicB
VRYAYPFTLTPDEDGRIVVGFPDVQGAFTDGADETEAVAKAHDCLIAALMARVTRHCLIPQPSPARGRPTVTQAGALCDDA